MVLAYGFIVQHKRHFFAIVLMFLQRSFVCFCVLSALFSAAHLETEETPLLLW